ncbi:hypothetical protein CDAR_380541, partial [Caerostris darwini]
MPGQLIFVNEDLVVVMLHHNDQDFYSCLNVLLTR